MFTFCKIVKFLHDHFSICSSPSTWWIAWCKLSLFSSLIFFLMSGIKRLIAFRSYNAMGLYEAGAQVWYMKRLILERFRRYLVVDVWTNQDLSLTNFRWEIGIFCEAFTINNPESLLVNRHLSTLQTFTYTKKVTLFMVSFNAVCSAPGKFMQFNKVGIQKLLAVI